jgi:hypothetical protein
MCKQIAFEKYHGKEPTRQMVLQMMLGRQLARYVGMWLYVQEQFS